MNNEIKLTQKEKTAVKKLKELANIWPETLWLFAGGQEGLAILRNGEDGKHVIDKYLCVDQEYLIDTVNIPSDGGDW